MTDTLAALQFPAFDPVALHVGPLAVRWYGIAYLAAFAAAYFILNRLARRGMLRIPPSALGDLVTWLSAGVMIGGRMGWWLFYHRDVGQAEPWYEPLAIWHGGMSFHGGLIGVCAALFLWTWFRRAPFWNVADALALVAPVGLFLGRLANLVNAELVGRPTDLPWGVIFPGDAFARHPSQIYEALLEGPALLALLCVGRRWLHGLRDGRTATLFVIFYGTFRFVVEFTRQPDEQVGFVAFGWLTMGQLLSVALALAGLMLRAFLRETPSKSSVFVVQQRPHDEQSGSGGSDAPPPFSVINSIHADTRFSSHPR